MIISQAKITPSSPHLQSFLASSKLRLRRLRHGSKVIEQQQEVCLETDFAKLQGFISEADSEHLVILIHGWEGSANSTYIQLLADTLFNSGCAVFRLNMRDHGDTHSWNEGLFNSCRLDEVAAAVREIQRRFAYRHYSLCGFSLGGNFALRIAAQAARQGWQLHRVFAISPVIDPKSSMDMMQKSSVYRRYFVRKWRKSLFKKAKLFPHLFADLNWQEERSLYNLTNSFVQKYTEFKNMDDYFAGYAITRQLAASIDCPTDVVTAWDDPVIPFADFATIDRLPKLRLITTPKGGHCGFIQGRSMSSWVERHIEQELKTMMNREK